MIVICNFLCWLPKKFSGEAKRDGGGCDGGGGGGGGESGTEILCAQRGRKALGGLSGEYRISK